MATDKQVEYVQSLQEECGVEGYTKEKLKEMEYEEISKIIDELKKNFSEIKENKKATSKQIELIMEMQEEAEVKWYNRNQIKKFNHQEIESLVIKLRNEVEINKMNRDSWKDQVNMWKEFEWGEWLDEYSIIIIFCDVLSIVLWIFKRWEK